MDPRTVFEQLAGSMPAPALDGRLLADDLVIEWPFAAPGRPRRIEGRDAFLAMAGPARAALPFRLDECRVSAVHETADPEVIVAEYELAGTLNATGERRAAAFISVLRVRDGRVVRWREYQDTYAISQAMAMDGLPTGS
jgi:ketosteroid isomerase-like protein